MCAWGGCEYVRGEGVNVCVERVRVCVRGEGVSVCVTQPIVLFLSHILIFRCIMSNLTQMNSRTGYNLIIANCEHCFENANINSLHAVITSRA